MAFPRTAYEKCMLDNHPHAHSVVMSYLGIRRSLGLLAFLLPLVLGPFGFFVLGIVSRILKQYRVRRHLL
jgi:hypothetical protein